MVLSTAPSPAQQFYRIYQLNRFFTELGSKLSYSLIPQYSTQAKYITIDTGVLYDLVKSDIPNDEETGRKMTKKVFGALREDTWRKNKLLPVRSFRDRRKGGGFNCEIKTDGVGCSVEPLKWIFSS